MPAGERRSISLSAVDRHGRILLLGIFAILLAGRFTLSRLGDGWPAIDLRLVGLGVVLIGWMLWLSVAREYLPRTSILGYTGSFTIFCIWMLLSASWSESDRLAEVAIDITLLWLVTVVGLAVSSRLHTDALASVWTWLFASGLIYLAAAVAQGPDHQGRYSALGGGPNVFVRVLILAAVAALALALTRRMLWTLWALPLFAAGMVLSGSRGGVATMLLVVLVGAVPLLSKMAPHVRRRLLGVCLFAGSLVVAFGGGTLASMWNQRFVEQTFVERHDASRFSIVDQALELIAQSPVIGSGLDGFHAANPRWEYAHNLFLAAGAEAGLIGIVLLVMPIISVGIILWRSRSLAMESVLYALAGFAILAASQTSGDFYDSRFMWFFFGLAAIDARRRRTIDRSRLVISPAQADEDEARDGWWTSTTISQAAVTPPRSAAVGPDLYSSGGGR